jgi:uncharacterized membrane protein
MDAKERNTVERVANGAFDATGVATAVSVVGALAYTLTGGEIGLLIPIAGPIIGAVAGAVYGYLKTHPSTESPKSKMMA